MSPCSIMGRHQYHTMAWCIIVPVHELMIIALMFLVMSLAFDTLILDDEDMGIGR